MSDHIPKAQTHKARKRFGQNFLHDQYVIGRIISSIHPQPDDCLVEIGPGMGALTGPILDATGKLHVVELDRDLIPILRTQFFNFPDFHIHEGDALKFDFSTIPAEGQQLRIAFQRNREFHANQVRRNRAMVEGVLTELFGASFRVTCEVDYNGEADPDAEDAGSPEDDERVQMVLQIFGGEVVR